ncbi:MULTISPECIES: class I SAM-dependent methyltransferase [Streptomyces]|uniref:Class I SAM-dependent methyltransferase n=2 Tax=Streptomyces TaxID=1883 RepID=A0ABW9IIH2_STRGJ|nr:MULTISPECIES: class I SAM-dependent methyltransferase [Streptomyces]QEU65524.1 class I SAM-dependent methyltransferase [Streptomyces galilaeus]GGW27191.1 methyltransferase type 12 [Streptomyces galilaeus]
MPPRPIHEPRRDNCPWCGSKRLRNRLRAPDLLHHRPGTFAVDECRDCAHAFQNPQLTAEGLALYHRPPNRDLPGACAERVLATRTRRHRLLATARAMLPYPEPESWLDVGTGHALFPEAAKEVFTYTSFDGLDPTPRVVRAQEAGRVEEAHQGQLTHPATSARLRARYDVVSMLGHVEHTHDPRAELRAALLALRPGGHLLLELPDPRSAFAALLGKWWVAHGQPRHLHLIPLPNLRAELESQGCTIVRADRSGAHVPHDLGAALALSLSRSVPSPRTALLRATAPLVAAATALDHGLAPLLRHTRFSNTYRVIARKP